MKEVEVISVIKTELLKRGDGINTPIRIITQYWDMNGKLLWEKDSIPLPQPKNPFLRRS